MDKEKSLSYEIVLFGGSAGALKVMREIISSLPVAFSVPVVVVLHKHADSNFDFLVETFVSHQTLVVKEVDDKEQICPGTIYLAPANYHVLIEDDRTLSLNVDDKVHYSRPSIDVLFESAVYAYRSGIIGIILSGANSDGAFGLQAIEKAGGLAVVQNPETAEFPVMPRAAMEKCEAPYILTTPEIARFIQERTGTF